MFPASNQGVGSNTGFPDVCTTPAAPVPIPIPYPNFGLNVMSMPFAPNVLVSAMPAHNMAAKPLMTNGDNAGVAHPLCMHPGGCTMGNPTVHINGLPAEHLLTPSYGNNFNNPLGAKLIPSVTNVLISRRSPRVGGRCTFAEGEAWTPGQLREMATDLMVPPGDVVWADLLAGGVGVLRVARFGLGSARRFAAGLRELIARGARRLVLDFRGNPGGAVSEAAAVVDRFVPRGVEIARVRMAGRTRIVRAQTEGCVDLPLTVLIDADTASAAEIAALALQAHGRAVVVGERSFGKGIGEMAVASSDAADEHRRIVAETSGPGGRLIQGVGVNPDVDQGAAGLGSAGLGSAGLGSAGLLGSSKL